MKECKITGLNMKELKLNRGGKGHVGIGNGEIKFIKYRD